MRCFFTFLIVAFSVTLSKGQLGDNFANAQHQGIDIADLDRIYMSGVHDDATKAAFAGQEKEYIDAYKKMIADLAQFLCKKGFKWEKPTRCFNRIYFKANGAIDYYLYNFKPGEIEENKEKEFKVLLNEFIKTYKFPLTNKVNFAQCSPVTYVN